MPSKLLSHQNAIAALYRTTKANRLQHNKKKEKQTQLRIFHKCGNKKAAFDFDKFRADFIVQFLCRFNESQLQHKTNYS